MKFADFGISPYFVIAFGKTFFGWGLALFVILPILLVLRRLCRKNRFIQYITGSFFFNLPLRTTIEMFIDLTIAVFVNFKFVRMSNMSEIVASIFVVGFGLFVVILPFALMGLI